VDEDGRPVVGGWVQVQRPVEGGDGWAEDVFGGRTDLSGVAVARGLPADGPFVLSAGGSSDERPLLRRVVAGWTGGSTKVVLSRAHDLLGRVLDAGGTPVPGARVRIEVPVPGEDDLASDWDRTNEDGTFHLSRLPTGVGALRVTLGDEAVLAREVRLPSEALDLRVDAGVGLHLVFEGVTRVEGEIRWQVLVEGRVIRGGTLAQGETRASAIALPPAEGYAAYAVAEDASRDTLLVAYAEGLAPREEPWRLTLVPGAEAEVEVVDLPEHVLPREVTVRATTAGGLSFQGQRGEGGLFHLRGLPPAGLTYEVDAWSYASPPDCGGSTTVRAGGHAVVVLEPR